MRHNPLVTWFRPKRFGYGWSPATWEGWAVTGLAVLLMVVIARLTR